jgi:hypothetical protein
MNLSPSFLLFVLFCLIACKKSPKAETIAKSEEEKPVVVGDCYMSVSGQDSILMQFVIENTSVAGQLHYRLTEKDKSGGALFGEMRGDTLIADYKFISEGIEAEREVAFLRRGNEFVEGFGDSEDKEGRVVFKNVSALRFEGQPLHKTDCDQLVRYFDKK